MLKMSRMMKLIIVSSISLVSLVNIKPPEICGQRDCVIHDSSYSTNVNFNRLSRDVKRSHYRCELFHFDCNLIVFIWQTG